MEVVAIVTPLGGDGLVHHAFTLRLLDIYTALSPVAGVRVLFSKHYAVDVAREAGVEYAVAQGAARILFIDSDIVPTDVAAVLKLLAADLPFVCGVYWEKNLRGLNLHVKHGGAYTNLRAAPQGMFPVDVCGLGFALIDAEVFKSLDRPWFSLKPMGEDVYFAEKARAIGVRPVAVGEAQALHIVGGNLALAPDGRLISLASSPS
ncbi:hypothetical protein [Pyrobaculum sp.]|uniref:hypothetical protein n=1 Tax=Pyrobaculum sp. TaxID=2004705 RepID=UPI003D0D25BB